MWSVDDNPRCGLLHVSYKGILYSIRKYCSFHKNFLIYIFLKMQLVIYFSNVLIVHSKMNQKNLA